jgi:hypothetical protein
MSTPPVVRCSRCGRKELATRTESSGSRVPWLVPDGWEGSVGGPEAVSRLPIRRVAPSGVSDPPI